MNILNNIIFILDNMIRKMPTRVSIRKKKMIARERSLLSLFKELVESPSVIKFKKDNSKMET